MTSRLPEFVPGDRVVVKPRGNAGTLKVPMGQGFNERAIPADGFRATVACPLAPEAPNALLVVPDDAFLGGFIADLAPHVRETAARHGLSDDGDQWFVVAMVAECRRLEVP